MGKRKILIVEDEILSARDIKRIVESFGYSVTAIASTSADAYKQALKEPPDLILMDIVLNSKKNGIETARLIRDRLDVPIVYLTAHSEKKFINEALATESYGYILKPVDEQNMQIAIELALHKHALEKTLREKQDIALRESEQRYRLLVENINEGIVMQNRDGIINYANRKFLEMIGYPENEVLGHSISEFLGEGLLRKKNENGPEVPNGGVKSWEIAWKRKDGKKVYTMLSPRPIFDEENNFDGVVAVLTDYTKRREAELALKRSREELRNLSHHLQSVREKESQRIAREIHDELGQQLTALKMDLSWLSKRVVLSDVGGKRYSEKLRSMSDLIDSTIQTVQKISSELRPGLLDDLGLFPALEWLVQDFQSRTKIKCSARFDCEELKLLPDISTAIFRISQEGLTNVARHSKADRVAITLKEKDDNLELRIRDNGKGIDEKKIFAPTSLGLMGMRERVRPFKGELSIHGVPDKGTTLKVVLPLNEAIQDD